MALIRDALSSLPAKPAIVIAPLIVAAVLSMYYWDMHERCAEVRQYRSGLLDYLRGIDIGGRFRLADFTSFEWNRVRIVARVAPGTIDDECPAGWNWKRGERESLLAAGKLTALIFGREGRVVGYFELNRERIAFANTDEQLTPETAVFKVERAADDGDVIRLERID